MTTQNTFQATIATLLSQDIRRGTQQVSRIYLGEDLIWERGARNVAPWGTLEELTAGTVNAPRWWSPAVLQNLVADWLATSGPRRIENKPTTIGEITETVVEMEAADHVILQDSSDANRYKRIRADNLIPALFAANIAIRVAGVECTVTYDASTQTLTVDNSALAGEVATHHPSGQT